MVLCGTLAMNLVRSVHRICLQATRKALVVAMRSWAGVHLLASDSRGLVTLMRLLRDPSASFSEDAGLQDVRHDPPGDPRSRNNVFPLFSVQGARSCSILMGIFDPVVGRCGPHYDSCTKYVLRSIMLG